MTINTTTKLFTALIALTLTIGTVSAVPEIDAVSFDPAFVSAGDTVNISANMHETQTLNTHWDKDKTLKAVLKPDNRLSREYVTIVEDRDESIGFLYPEGVWNQNYQVKVDSNAPTGNYRFEIHFKYKDSEESLSFIEDFVMPVEKEGVELSTNTLSTDPRQPRPGDDYVTQSIQITNTGNKPVEEIEIYPETPENIELAYSDDEKFYIDRINAGETTRIDLGLELDEDLAPGRHSIKLETLFEDTDSNQYNNTLGAPIRVEGRPDLELVSSEFNMKAGDSETIKLEIKNTGSQDAESVTARLLSERTQPFSLADRSDYIGEIKAGETGEAVLKIKSDRSASQKTHELKIQLRSSGDSEEGDSSTYTFTETQKVKLEGKTHSLILYAGLVGALIVLAILTYRIRKGSENEEGGEE